MSERTAKLILLAIAVVAVLLSIYVYGTALGLWA